MFFERAKAESDDFATLIDGTKSDSLSDSVVMGGRNMVDNSSILSVDGGIKGWIRKFFGRKLNDF